VLLLSAVGLFGLMAFTVGRRTREIGIRIALGAEPRAILYAVMRRTLTLTGAGCAVGLAASIATTRYLEGFLFDLSPLDPVAIGGAVVLLVAVASVAGLLPARRAARVDPVTALRAE
jgi:ABC-type antimicrobial peptide transport system permease subunit